MTELNSELIVAKIAFPDLLKKSDWGQIEFLKIPDYQRNYAWNESNLEKIVDDLIEFEANQEQKLKEYFLGTIVLHKEEHAFNVVDGQQRLTTLLIIDYVLNGDHSFLTADNENILFEFKSENSKYNVKKNQGYINELAAVNKQKLRKALSKIVFVVTITQSADDAFIFFDTQNNRGLKPSFADLLKAIHLRRIIGNETLQNHAAVLWEDIEKSDSSTNDLNQLLPWHKPFFMTELIEKVLWRARKWKYGYVEFEDDAKIEKAFYLNLKNATDNTITIYPNHTYQLFNQMYFNSNNEVCFSARSYSSNQNPKDYPISLRQPLKCGITFFKYVQKYHALLQYIFTNPANEKFQKFFEIIYKHESDYMKQALVLACLTYADKFGTEKLVRFAEGWDYATGHLRQFSYSFRKEKFPNYIKDRKLLDKIANAYDTDEVFYELNKEIKEMHIKSISRPMRRYNKNCILYYELTASTMETDEDQLRENYHNKRKIIIEKFKTV